MNVKVTSMVRFYTLFLLSRKPMHGYDLIKEVGEQLGTKISASHIYPFLQVLEKSKYISHEKPGAREKKKYHMTPEGKKFAAEIMSRFSGALDAAVEAKTHVCVHCDAKILGIGYCETIKGKRLNFCCSYCAASYKKGTLHAH